MRSLFRPVLICLILLVAFSSRAEEFLTWHTNQDRVSADIKSGSLIQVLEAVAKLTGWHVFLESNTTHTVSTKFKDVPSGEALHLLFPDLNYAFVPQTNGPSQLYVFRTVRANARQQIGAGESRSVKKDAHVPNELIVRIKPGANIDEIAKLLGAKVVGKIDGLNAYRLQFDDAESTSAALDKLKSNSDVLSAEYNNIFDPPPSALALDNPPVGPVSLALNPSSDSDPCVPVVGLVDTPIQSLGSDLDKFVKKQLSVAGDAKVNTGSPTHATGVAQTILRATSQSAGGSSSVKILPVDIYGGSETTTSWNVALGIQAAVNNGANILNLSLGSPSDSAILSDVIQQATSKGILVFAAAGNEPVKTATYPAADSGVIAVTALQGSQLAPYANSGNFVDVALPGASVIYLGSQAYVVQGTSIATGYASGVAAGAKGKNCWTAAQIQAAMQQKFPVPQK